MVIKSVMAAIGVRRGVLTSFVFLICLGLGPSAFAQSSATFPDTPAGRVFRAWLDAFNSGDAARLQAYYDKHMPGQGMVAFAGGTRATTGGFELVRIVKSEPRRIDYVVKDKLTPTQQAGAMVVSAAETPTVEGLTLRPMPPNGEFPLAEVDAALRVYAERVVPPTAAEIPDTPAGRMLRSWVDVFNEGDAARMQGFYERHAPAMAASAASFRQQTGGFIVTKIIESEPQRIEFFVRERARPQQAIGSITLNAADQTKIESFPVLAFPPNAEFIGTKVDAAARASVIDGIIAKMDESYVFPETVKKMEADLRGRLKRGEFDKFTNGSQFAEELTKALQAVSKDKHIRVNFNPMKMPPPPANPTPPPLEAQERMRAQMRAQMEKTQCSFQPAEILPGNIGLLKFNGFTPPEFCMEIVDAAMKPFADVDALIVDLRTNGGGSPDMVAYISSYFFDKPTHLNNLWTRKTDETKEFWTRDVPGKRIAKQPMYVLTSSRTFSGAEEFAYNLKSLKRATVVGEVTGGGAHPVSGQRLDDRFMVGVPFARAINPITKTNWEGTGVEPDVKVPADQALETAKKLASERIAKK